MAWEESVESWRRRIYRQVAHLIHEPTLDAEAHLRSLIAEYRRSWDMRAQHAGDPHEVAMDYT